MTIALSRFDELKLERVGRRFRVLDALRDVDLTVRRGEFIALLGPSGCGKSTALNCLAGLLPISSGRIMLDDRRIDTLRPEERGFGMVFQNYALFPHMTVRQNIGFGLKMRRVAKAEAARRIDEAIRLVRLQGHEAKLPGQMSGGQQQRVAIARAVVVEPTLVLMDEPLSNLDAKLRLEMRAEIRRIHNELGATTIYVTHDQDEALSLADRIVVLRDGSIRQVGAPRELYGAPIDLDVAEFMGFRNRLPGICIGRRSDRARVRIGDAVLEGIVRDGVAEGEPAVAVFRPDDVSTDGDAASGLSAQVETIEYRGREFIGEARTVEGLQIVFRSHEAVPPGSSVKLNADANRVIVFPASS
jgi:putative spermidine/putrescine transport system ATP-binding protein